MQIGLHKYVQADEGHQVRKVSVISCDRLQCFKDENDDQCGPDLNHDGIFARSDDGFDVQILFDFAMYR